MFDIVIIGGGLGGLTAGAKLARSGKKVLLLEQHDRVGGCATTFKRKDFTLEVGLHEMDGVHPRDMKSRIFRDLDITNRITLIQVPEFYRFVNGRQDVVVSHDPEEMKERLTRIFPDDQNGITAYFDQVMNIRQIMKQNLLDPEMTIGRFLDQIIKNEDLKLILLGNLGYFHDDPYGLSLGYYCMAQNSYYTGGGNFIRGGSQMLSDALASVIRENAGQVWLNHRATAIVVEAGRASGVVCRTKDGEEQLVQAKEIIANASIPQVAEELLPDHLADFTKEFVHLKPGASLLTVYFGFSRSPATIGHTYYSTFVYDDSVKSQKDILPNNRGSYTNRGFTFVDYSQIDSALAPEGKAVGAICCMDYTDDWDQLDRKSYKEMKNQVELIFRDRLEKLIPGINQLIEYCEVGTAKTIQRYTMNPGGAVYGFAQTTERVKTSISSPLPNLHFASAWTQTGGGFSGAIFSGYLCALDVIRKKS